MYMLFSGWERIFKIQWGFHPCATITDTLQTPSIKIYLNILIRHLNRQTEGQNILDEALRKLTAPWSEVTHAKG